MSDRTDVPSVEMLHEARRAIEAVLLVATEPTPVQLLAQLIELPVDAVQAMCLDLAEEYESQGRGFQLVEIAGGWRYQTHPDTHAYVERFAMEGIPNRLSSAALETLAIVAYKQPISRAQIGAIRGVNVDGVLRTLSQQGYVEERGHDDGPGQATLFGTTTFFLERLGLMSLDDLPPLGDFVPSAQVLEALEQTLKVEGMDGPRPDVNATESMVEANGTPSGSNGTAEPSVNGDGNGSAATNGAASSNGSSTDEEIVEADAPAGEETTADDAVETDAPADEETETDDEVAVETETTVEADISSDETPIEDEEAVDEVEPEDERPVDEALVVPPTADDPARVRAEQAQSNGVATRPDDAGDPAAEPTEAAADGDEAGDETQNQEIAAVRVSEETPRPPAIGAAGADDAVRFPGPDQPPDPPPAGAQGPGLEDRAVVASDPGPGIDAGSQGDERRNGDRRAHPSPAERSAADTIDLAAGEHHADSDTEIEAETDDDASLAESGPDVEWPPAAEAEANDAEAEAEVKDEGGAGAQRGASDVIDLVELDPADPVVASGPGQAPTTPVEVSGPDPETDRA